MIGNEFDKNGTGLSRQEEKEYNESYSDNSSKSISRKVVEALAIGTAAATAVGVGSYANHAYSDYQDDKALEIEKNNQANEIMVARNSAGYPMEYNDYFVSEKESYDKIAEIQLLAANIKPTPKLIEDVREYLMNINGANSSLLLVDQKLRVPAYLGDDFKKHFNTENALPESETLIFLDQVPNRDLSGFVGVIVSPDIASTNLAVGESIDEVASTIPGYSEFAKGFPKFAIQVKALIRSENPGVFDQNGKAIRSGVCLTRDGLFFNLPTLGLVIKDNNVEES